MARMSVDDFARDDERDQQRERDLHMLGELLRDEHAPGLDDRGSAESLSVTESEAFADMRGRLDDWDMRKGSRSKGYQTLTPDQRRWVERVCERLAIDTTPPRLRKPVPRGREVAIAPVLQHLPKRPPGRR